MHKYTSEQKEYLKRVIPGNSHRDITDMVNDEFGINLTVAQIASFIKNNKLNTGRTGRFQKGQVSHNKGKKGICANGCEKTWFKEGHMPHNHKPVGSERVDEDGYIWVKVKEPKTWRMKHVLTWEESFGPLPKGHVIIFGDRDKTNFAIENLILVSRAELLRMNRHDLIKNDAELTRTGVIIADVLNACGKKRSKK